MSDLREQIVKTLQSAGWPMSAERAVSNVWPIIEAELQKRDREIADLRESLRSKGAIHDLQKEGADHWFQRYHGAMFELTEANKLLEQTIEVLEDLDMRLKTWPSLYSRDAKLWFALKAKPFLDKLQALKKEGTE